jgi:hypothetical protein
MRGLSWRRTSSAVLKNNFLNLLFGEIPFLLRSPGHSGLQPKELFFIDFSFVALDDLAKELTLALLLPLGKPVVFLGDLRRNRNPYPGISSQR